MGRTSTGRAPAVWLLGPWESGEPTITLLSQIFPTLGAHVPGRKTDLGPSTDPMEWGRDLSPFWQRRGLQATLPLPASDPVFWVLCSSAGSARPGWQGLGHIQSLKCPPWDCKPPLEEIFVGFAEFRSQSSGVGAVVPRLWSVAKACWL